MILFVAFPNVTSNYDAKSTSWWVRVAEPGYEGWEMVGLVFWMVGGRTGFSWSSARIQKIKKRDNFFFVFEAVWLHMQWGLPCPRTLLRNANIKCISVPQNVDGEMHVTFCVLGLNYSTGHSKRELALHMNFFILSMLITGPICDTYPSTFN